MLVLPDDLRVMWDGHKFCVTYGMHTGADKLLVYLVGMFLFHVDNDIDRCCLCTYFV